MTGFVGTPNKLEIRNSSGLRILGFVDAQNMSDPPRPCRIEGAKDLFIIGPNHPLYLICETWDALASEHKAGKA